MKVPTDNRIKALLKRGYTAKIYKHRGGVVEVTFTYTNDTTTFGISYLPGDGWTTTQMAKIADKAKWFFGGKARIIK